MNVNSAVSHAVALLREERTRIDRALSALGANGTVAQPPRPQAATVTLRAPSSGTLRARVLVHMMNTRAAQSVWRTGELCRAMKCSAPGLGYALAQALDARQIRRVGRGRWTLRAAN